MKKNGNLKDGVFKVKELSLYEGLDSKDIDVILEYQKRLPVLQEGNGSWINSRSLHEQLGVGRDYTTWIKSRIQKYSFEEDSDYKVTLTKSGERQNVVKHDYILSLDMAKQLAMVENNKTGTIARKYFIAIEKAFKERYNWNIDRYESIEMCHQLKSALSNNKTELEEYVPDWWYFKNIYSYEFNILNETIIGMTASQYRKENGLNKSEPIRNTFTEKQLYKVHKLEDYDAILLDINNILDTDKRRKLLEKYYIERLS